MCHGTDSRPPAPPDPGEVAAHGPVVLTSADGTAFSAYAATPVRPREQGVVILPDIRGLHPFYVALAQRFAEAGYHAVAIDYFGRTAGTTPRGDDFEFRPHVDQVDPQNVLADARAALDHLRGQGIDTVFSVGFCFGGGQSWRLAATDLPIAGAVGFYGRLALLSEVADGVHAPLLMLIAGADRTTPEEFAAVAERISDAGSPVDMQVYDGAPHSFFDRAYADWADACADAWARIIAFTERHR